MLLLLIASVFLWHEGKCDHMNRSTENCHAVNVGMSFQIHNYIYSICRKHVKVKRGNIL